ncbi:hypothetical protein AURDEDRAFT_126173 [Auricularia subglabra TFB-10046 SS5]|nr:hypothetical protein AURDEDRAFT_126173 [Auricularia subglabra TFB-10046 SS5]
MLPRKASGQQATRRSTRLGLAPTGSKPVVDKPSKPNGAAANSEPSDSEEDNDDDDAHQKNSPPPISKASISPESPTAPQEDPHSSDTGSKRKQTTRNRPPARQTLKSQDAGSLKSAKVSKAAKGRRQKPTQTDDGDDDDKDERDDSDAEPARKKAVATAGDDQPEDERDVDAEGDVDESRKASTVKAADKSRGSEPQVASGDNDRNGLHSPRKEIAKDGEGYASDDGSDDVAPFIKSKANDLSTQPGRRTKPNGEPIARRHSKKIQQELKQNAKDSALEDMKSRMFKMAEKIEGPRRAADAKDEAPDRAPPRQEAEVCDGNPTPRHLDERHDADGSHNDPSERHSDDDRRDHDDERRDTYEHRADKRGGSRHADLERRDHDEQRDRRDTSEARRNKQGQARDRVRRDDGEGNGRDAYEDAYEHDDRDVYDRRRNVYDDDRDVYDRRRNVYDDDRRERARRDQYAYDDDRRGGYERRRDRDDRRERTRRDEDAYDDDSRDGYERRRDRDDRRERARHDEDEKDDDSRDAPKRRRDKDDRRERARRDEDEKDDRRRDASDRRRDKDDRRERARRDEDHDDDDRRSDQGRAPEPRSRADNLRGDGSSSVGKKSLSWRKYGNIKGSYNQLGKYEVDELTLNVSDYSRKSTNPRDPTDLFYAAARKGYAMNNFLESYVLIMAMPTLGDMKGQTRKEDEPPRRNGPEQARRSTSDGSGTAKRKRQATDPDDAKVTKRKKLSEDVEAGGSNGQKRKRASTLEPQGSSCFASGSSPGEDRSRGEDGEERAAKKSRQTQGEQGVIEID